MPDHAGASRFAAEPAELMSDQVRPRALRPHLVRSSLFLGPLVVFLLGWALSVSVTILSSAMVFNTSALGISPQMATLLGPVCVAGMLFVFLAWTATLFYPVQEPVGEFGSLVGDAAAAESAVRERITAHLRSRSGPYAVAEAAESGSVLVDHGGEHALVTVRAVGADLFIGWFMWRTRSTVRLVLDAVASARAPSLITGAGAAIAMRELLRHASAAGAAEAVAAAPPDGDG